jgi:hypothetical protein
MSLDAGGKLGLTEIVGLLGGRGRDGLSPDLFYSRICSN